MKHDGIIIAGLLTCLLGAVTLSGNADDKAFKRDRYLVLDSRIIGNTENAQLTVGVVRKDKHNPLFGEDKPWEKRFDNLYANLIFDQEDKVYKCWYSPFIVDRSAKGMTLQQRGETSYRPPGGREMAICYAVSKDGIQWEKPELGLVEFEGSKQNNILWRGPHGAGVFKDYRDPNPARRYKAFFQGVSVAFSADGIHWGKAIPCPEIKVAGDTHNNALWAPTLDKYVGITRTWGKQRGRQVARTVSDDFLNWTKAEVVLEGLGQNLQVYAMPVFYRDGLYLGLAAIHDQKADRVWTELTWSPDTVHWNRVCPGTPLIGNSPNEGDYDWGCVYAGADPVFLEDQIRIYYGGSNGKHTSWRDGFLCLATLKPDHWAGYEPMKSDQPAIITTSEIACTGQPLGITADVGKGGSVKVSVVDRDGKQLSAAKPVMATVTDGELHWDREMKSGPMRLRFEISGSKLYSFCFSASSSATSSAKREDQVTVGLKKQLLVDDFVLAGKQNVTRGLGQLKKTGVVCEPSLESDFHPEWRKPDGTRTALDFGFYLSVIYNEKDKKFQMWYMAGVQGRFHSRDAGVGYAESEDGLHWTKPMAGKDGKDNTVHYSQGFSCDIDPNLPWGHPEKYKAALDNNLDRVTETGIAYSSDGIRWTDYNDGKPVTHRAADTRNQILWDPVGKRYCLLTRTDLGG